MRKNPEERLEVDIKLHEEKFSESMTGYQTTNHAKKMPNVYVSFPWWRATDH